MTTDNMTTYELTGVSMGPGDPDLITVKALRALQAADIIFALRSKQTGEAAAYDIATAHIDEARQQVHFLDIERGRRAGERTAVWVDVADDISDVMRRYAEDKAAPQVRGVLVQLGDASLYGTFDYAAVPLRERHPMITLSVIAGVSAHSELAARLQMPLSSIDERVCVLPATYEDDAGIRDALMMFDTVILLKAGFVRPRLLNLLDELDMLEFAVYGERVGLDEDIIVRDVTSLPRDEKGSYLSMFIVHGHRNSSDDA